MDVTYSIDKHGSVVIQDGFSTLMVLNRESLELAIASTKKGRDAFVTEAYIRELEMYEGALVFLLEGGGVPVADGDERTEGG